MGITIKFDKSKLHSFREVIEAKIITAMMRVGEDFAKAAKDMTKSQGGFGDVTGNLRSSIGYFILKDGKIIKSKFDGNPTGKMVAKRCVDGLPYKEGLRLVGIAGMNYASLVEAKGLNVISIQAEAAIIDLKEYLEVIAESKN